MKRLILVAAGGLFLATANTPPTTGAVAAKPEGELTSVVAAEAPGAATAAKPSRPAKPARIAVAPEPGTAYPRCSATVRDRCAQGHYSAQPARHREVQYAMRAGERG